MQEVRCFGLQSGKRVLEQPLLVLGRIQGRESVELVECVDEDRCVAALCVLGRHRLLLLVLLVFGLVVDGAAEIAVAGGRGLRSGRLSGRRFDLVAAAVGGGAAVVPRKRGRAGRNDDSSQAASHRGRGAQQLVAARGRHFVGPRGHRTVEFFSFALSVLHRRRRRRR